MVGVKSNIEMSEIDHYHLSKPGWSKTASMKVHITVGGKIGGPQSELHCN